MVDNIVAIFNKGPKPDTMEIKFKRANVKMIVNRGMDHGFIDFRIDLGGRLSGGQSGHCGNFNGNAGDDQPLYFGNDWYNPRMKVGRGETLFHTFDLRHKNGNYCGEGQRFKIVKKEGDFTQACAYKCAGNKYFVT